MFYTGYTNDLGRRIAEHNNGNVQSTKYRLPVELFYFEGCLNQQEATHRETYSPCVIVNFKLTVYANYRIPIK